MKSLNFVKLEKPWKDLKPLKSKKDSNEAFHRF